MATLTATRNPIELLPFKVQDVDRQIKQEIPKGVQMIQAPAFWEKGHSGKGVTIAVLDTGCDPLHPDLKDRIVEGSKNFTDDDGGNPAKFNDYNGHGTHVAGTIAASQNDQGVVGVAPEASLLILKVLNKAGSGNPEWITKAIHYAVEQRVHIISMSLSSLRQNEAMHEAVKRAVENNIIVVCAAGNNGRVDDNGASEFNYPAAYNESTSVGAVDFSAKAPVFQSTNNQVDLTAPGVNILSAYPLDLVSDKANPYKILSGTSMAAPHAAGALALLINHCQSEFGRKLTEAELYAQLVKRTIPLGSQKSVEGNGLLYLTAAEQLADHLRQHPIDLSQYA